MGLGSHSGRPVRRAFWPTRRWRVPRPTIDRTPRRRPGCRTSVPVAAHSCTVANRPERVRQWPPGPPRFASGRHIVFLGPQFPAVASQAPDRARLWRERKRRRGTTRHADASGSVGRPSPGMPKAARRRRLLPRPRATRADVAMSCPSRRRRALRHSATRHPQAP